MAEIRRIKKSDARLAEFVEAEHGAAAADTVLVGLGYTKPEIDLWRAPEPVEPPLDGSIIAFTAYETRHVGIRRNSEWYISSTTKRTGLSWEDLLHWGGFSFRATLKVLREGEKA